MTEEEHINVRLYFVSGKDERFHFPKTIWDETKEALKKNWDGTISFGDFYSVNFSKVMYYEIES